LALQPCSTGGAMKCMLTAPRAVAAVVPRLGFRLCATSGGAADPPVRSPLPPPGPPPPEAAMWENNSGQRRRHRQQSDVGQRQPHWLPQPPPGPRPWKNTTAFLECTENTTIGFGKHRGRTFGDVFHAEPNYCSWVLQEAKRSQTRCSTEFVAFATYIRGQGIHQQQGGPENSLDERQPENSFWCRPSDEPKVASMVQGNGEETPDDDASADLASGQWKVTFGDKHVGLSFAEVLETDAAYCNFVTSQVLHSTMPPATWIDSKVLSFVTYFQHMRLRADPTHTVRW